MTDLLTQAEYKAIAEALDPPRTPFIDGKCQRGDGPMMATMNPATGDEITQISTASAKDVDLAVTKAREAFDQGHWSKLDPEARKDVLIRLCKLGLVQNHLKIIGRQGGDSFYDSVLILPSV